MGDSKELKQENQEPLVYDPQYILMVRDLKKYFPIKGGMVSHVVGLSLIHI